jgi:hypothetical protein
MPSDDRVPEIMRALRSTVDIYEAAIGAAMDRIDSLLACTSDGDVRDSSLELGPFASGRIDAQRLAALNDDHQALDQADRAILGEARLVLQDHAGMNPRRLIVDVPSGGRMSNAVMQTFAELGRPFGAALVAEMLRRGRFDRDEHGSMLHAFPRYRWNRAERAASPPLVVVVDGADLWAGELTPFLDGNQRIVLIVRSPAPPAALVRVITPGTLVFQTSSDETAGALLTKYAGVPSVGALVPEGCAEFVHAPEAGRSTGERLTLTSRPQGPRKALPSWTLWQQEQELQQLLALAAPPPVSAAATTGNGAAPTPDPTERLAAWLLSQADTPAPRG